MAKCPFYKGKTKRDTIRFFSDRGIIDEYGNVTDYKNFHVEVNKWSRVAFNRYGKNYSIAPDDKLILIEDGSNGKKYVPNTYMMEQIDQAKIDGWNRGGNGFWDNLNNDGTDIDPDKQC